MNGLEHDKCIAAVVCHQCGREAYPKHSLEERLSIPPNCPYCGTTVLSHSPERLDPYGRPLSPPPRDEDSPSSTTLPDGTVWEPDWE